MTVADQRVPQPAPTVSVVMPACNVAAYLDNLVLIKEGADRPWTMVCEIMAPRRRLETRRRWKEAGA